MNKVELVAAVAEEMGVSKAEAGRAVDAVFGSVSSTLVAGGKVAVAGFGTFEAVDRAARTGRNPQTGEPVEIAASKAVKFKVAKALKDSVKG